ncbi:MAG: TldD/PmbA family protein [Elusimicrobia bacterium]|nr:TldD/PmbA family protein [Elusimicrobiota bacterium]
MRQQGWDPDLQVELFLVRGRGRTRDWSEGQPEGDRIAESEGVGLRVIAGGRVGFAYTNEVSLAAVETIWPRALAALRCAAPRPPFQLARREGRAQEGPNGQGTESLGVYDPALGQAQDGWEQRVAPLAEVEPKLLALDPRLKKVFRASYRESVGEVAIVNSAGLNEGTRATQASFSLACVAEDQGETQVGGSFFASRFYQDLDWGWTIRDAAQRTAVLLGGRPIPSGRSAVVFDPAVTAEFLNLLAPALCADQVQKGQSFLAQRLGQPVGSRLVTLVDDGRLPKGLATSAFDDEGVPTQRLVLIEQGRLDRWLYDIATAARDGVNSTGNASRPSFHGAPEPDTSNLFLLPGALSPEALIASTPAGVYVMEVMGSHTVDTISGEFSVGLVGRRIEDGQLTHAGRGVTLAGDLKEFLGRIDAVGQDLRFFGSTGAPTVRVQDLTIGGT